MKLKFVIITTLLLLLVGCAQNPDEIVIPKFEPKPEPKPVVVVEPKKEQPKEEPKIEMPVPFETGVRARTPGGCEEARKQGADC